MADKENPTTATQRLARPVLPRRFYKNVSVGPADGGFAVLLDGRAAKTPGRKPLVVASRTVADALAAEWEAQRDVIDPGGMPLTRLVNAAIDRVAADPSGVRAEIVKYAMSDAVCYRAETPASLVAAQERAWAPLVAWARERLGVRLRLTAGVVHVAQDQEVATAVEAATTSLPAVPLAALHLAMTLTGSAIVALALLEGRLTADEAWSAAHVDEDWQMAQWGADEIALSRRAARRRDFDAAVLVLAGLVNRGGQSDRGGSGQSQPRT